MKNISLFILIIFSSYSVYCQLSFSESNWKTHFNLLDIKKIESINHKIYCFGEYGYYYFDLSEKSINVKANYSEFSDIKTSDVIRYNNELIIIYESGLIDIIKNESIYSLNLSFDLENIKVNSSYINNYYLYVSTSKGLYKVNLDSREVIEKISNIGENGNQVDILNTKIFNDTIFLITAENIFFSHIDKNLLDFNNWEKENFLSTNFLGSFINGNNIYFYNDNQIISSSGHIIFEFNSSIIKIKSILDVPHILSLDSTSFEYKFGYLDELKFYSKLYVSDNILTDFLYLDGSFWLSGYGFGLYKLNDKLYFTPNNSPSINPLSLKKVNNSLYGYGNSNRLIEYKDNRWLNKELNNFSDISSVEIFKNKLYVSSKKMGILDIEKNFVFDGREDDSPFQESNENGDVNISDISVGLNQMWILNYGAESPLISYTEGGEWIQHDLGSYSSNYPVELNYNGKETFWIRNDNRNSAGLTIYNASLYKTKTVNVSNGLLKSNNVNSVLIDLDDKVWIGSDKGLIYFTSSSFDDILNNDTYLVPNDGEKNIFQNIKINTLLFDHSNNLWIGTDQGLFIYNPYDKKIIKQLDESNSPLFSSKILDLDKNSLGEIFVLTSAGLLSFRSFNQASNQNLNSIKVFPNPLILKEHEGLIINGLLKNNYIKILSLNGNEVISLNYRGGGINWNLLNRNNKKISPGIYLIYIVSEDGSQSFLTKFLVI